MKVSERFRAFYSKLVKSIKTSFYMGVGVFCVLTGVLAATKSLGVLDALSSTALVIAGFVVMYVAVRCATC